MCTVRAAGRHFSCVITQCYLPRDLTRVNASLVTPARQAGKPLVVNSPDEENANAVLNCRGPHISSAVGAIHILVPLTVKLLQFTSGACRGLASFHGTHSYFAVVSRQI